MSGEKDTRWRAVTEPAAGVLEAPLALPEDSPAVLLAGNHWRCFSDPSTAFLATFLWHPGIHSPAWSSCWEDFNFSSEVSCAGPPAALGQLSAHLVEHIWFKRAKLSSFPPACWHCKETSVSSTFLLLPAEPCLPVALSHQKGDHCPQPTLVSKRRNQIQSSRSAVGSILPRPPDGIFEHFTWSVMSNWLPGFAQTLWENAKNSIFFF